MTSVFADTLHSWQNFYFMTGGAAVTLIGLMFVALSLGMPLVSQETVDDMQSFVAPSVVYFVSALLISCIMLVPNFDAPTTALLFAIGTLVGYAFCVPDIKRLIRIARREQDFHIGDWMTQIIVPVVSYTVLMGAALCLALENWQLAFLAVWIADMLLLLCAIADTWSLVVWVVRNRK